MIAHALDAPSAEAVTAAGTVDGVIPGAVGYMSPEQAMGRSADFRSDQFSFRAVMQSVDPCSFMAERC